MPARRLEIPDLDDRIQRYLNGESAADLAKEIGVCDSVIRKRIKERGIDLRPRSSYPTNMEPCWEASRNRGPQPAWRQEQRARTNAARMNNVSPHEYRLWSLLWDAGWEFTQQRTIGPYNVDLAYEPLCVAVEVLGGGYSARIRAARPKRIEYLLDQGWHLVEVSLGKQRPISGEPDLTGAANYLIAFLKELRWKPAAPREHRMIRRDGEPRSSRRPYEDCRSNPPGHVTGSNRS